MKLKECHPRGAAACHANLAHGCDRLSTAVLAESSDAVLRSEDFAYLEYFSER